jgi:Uma2 family endonuclease
MSLAETPASGTMLTVEEFLAPPDDGIDRDLINGELRVWGESISRGTPIHSEVVANLAYLLGIWRDVQPLPRGKVVGAAGFRLRHNRQTLVGSDLACVSAEMAAAPDRKRKYFDGPPVLAIEILSPPDTHERIVEKVEVYLEVGTVVWVVDPDFRTVSIHRSGELVETLNDRQELSGDPYLPGFRVSVAMLFDA